MTYPHTMSEFKTLRLVCQGRSLARFGDGEFNLANGGRAKEQAAHPVLASRLRSILADSGECLVGIPNILSETPKAGFWRKYLMSASALLMSGRVYASAFVTRPDSAPWIDTVDYWEQVQALWVGKDITLVRGTSRSLTAGDLVGARSVREVLGPMRDAFGEYDQLLEEIGTPTVALLCLGPAATVMAVDLAAKGVHAIDLGHVGLFLKKHRRGEPMVVTDADKVVAA